MRKPAARDYFVGIRPRPRCICERCSTPDRQARKASYRAFPSRYQCSPRCSRQLQLVSGRVVSFKSSTGRDDWRRSPTPGRRRHFYVADAIKLQPTASFRSFSLLINRLIEDVPGLRTLRFQARALNNRKRTFRAISANLVSLYLLHRKHGVRSVRQRVVNSIRPSV